MDELRKELDFFKSVCIHEIERNHGSFLTHIFEAFLRADLDNSKLMLPLMKQLTEKYRLQPES